MSDAQSPPDPSPHRSPNRIEVGTADRRYPRRGHRESKDDGGLTIFIANRNDRASLPRSLRSALDALRHLDGEGLSAEILVIDDASRDGSQKLLRTVQALYDEPRLRTVCLQQDFGLPALRNLALRMSRFRYVCLMEAGDELVPGNLPLFWRSIRETGATLIYGNLIGKREGEAVGARSNMTASLQLTKANYVDAFSIVDAGKTLELGGYVRKPHVPDDWEMVLHLIAEEERIVFVPAVLGYYHENRGYVAPDQESAAALRRVYAQTGTREWDDVQVGRIYHPDVGFVDEW